MNIKAVLFDLGEVLVSVNLNRAVSQLADYLTIDEKEINFYLFNDNIKDRFDSGLIEPEDFYLNFCQQAKKQPPFDIFVEYYTDIFSPLYDGFKAVKYAAQRVPIFLLSNTDTLHWNRILNDYKEIMDLFSGYHLSFKAGVNKPDPKYFIKFLNKSNLQASSCLFIDDNLKNIKTAENLSFMTLRRTRQMNLETELKNFF